MIIKRYLQFINEDHKTDFGCVMMNLKISNWEEIIGSIDSIDLYKGIGVNDDSYGLENNPHITVFFGLHDSIPDEKIISIINKYKYEDYSFEVIGIDSFRNENFDVLKFSVKCDNSLRNFNNELSQFPNSNDYPKYSPHITVAYLNKGTVDKYINEDIKIDGLEVTSIVYSKPNGQKLIYEKY